LQCQNIHVNFLEIGLLWANC